MFYSTGVSGALLAPLKWFFYVSLLLLALILAAWIVDWVFVFKVWPEGLTRLKSLLDADLARAASLGGWDNELHQFAVGTANVLYEVAFKLTGIHDMGSRFANGAPLSIPDTIARNTYLANYEAIQVAMTGIQLFGVRLAVLLTSLPLFGLAYVVAMVDGLAQRAIRRASGGHESSSIYHRAQYFQVSLHCMFATLCLLLPLSIDPRWILLPGVTVLAILVHLQWKYYKKHL
jgi:integrating conjugative element membrane protein (TIGR03747 family)